MPVSIFRGEASMDKLADRLFNRLTDRQRDKAIKALLRANPGLRNLSAIPAGTPIVVPDVAGFRGKVSAATDAPEADTLRRISDSLAGFTRDETRRRKERRAHLMDEARAVSSRDFRSLIRRAPELEKLAEDAGAALDKRIEAADAEQEALQSALRAAMDDLGKRLK